MRKFFRSENGNVAILGALLIPTLLAGAGLAIDYSRLTAARAQLQQATDAAILAAAKDKKSASQRRQAFDDLLRVDTDRLQIARASLDINEGLNHIELTADAAAKVQLLFFNRLGVQEVSVTSKIYQSSSPIAISLVLDNTGSMGSAGILALRQASHALLDAVEDSMAENQAVYIGLVPFVTAVNIKGEGFKKEWIDTKGRALYNGWSFLDASLRNRRRGGERLLELPAAYAEKINEQGQACNNEGQGAPAIEKRSLCDRILLAKQYPHQFKLFELSGTTWKGCVEARPEPYNLDLTPPSPDKPDTLFVPYFAPDEPGAATWSGGNDGNSFNNSWLQDAVAGSDELVQRSTLKYVDPDLKLVEEGKSLTRGPNRACPTPITPLTTDIKKVRAAINAMQFWYGSGTNISEGLAWGWRVLSPEAPYTEAKALEGTKVAKFAVLMTDGRNVSFGNKNTHNKSDYGSYGFLADGRIDGTAAQGAAETKLNEYTLATCDAMKKQGIEIFTVVSNEKAPSVHDMFRSCASKPTNFYMATDTTQLHASFASIGSKMSMLRLTQ